MKRSNPMKESNPIKRSLLLLLCAALVLTCLPLSHASAGDPGWSYSFFLPKGMPNTKTMKLKVDIQYKSSGSDTFSFRLKQTAVPSVRVTPDGEAQIPFTIGMKVFDNYLDDTKPTRHLFDEKEMATYQSDIGYMKDSIFYFTLDALHLQDSIEHKGYNGPTGYELPFYDRPIVKLEYDANGYTVMHDLEIILPESTDYAIDAAKSGAGVVCVNVAQGKTLPADSKLRFAFGEKKVRKAEKSGWFTYGKSKSHLPAIDPEALAAYPALENACYLTYQVVDKKAKVIHYGVLHGQWPAETPAN